jgi:hypothetical protein
MMRKILSQTPDQYIYIIFYRPNILLCPLGRDIKTCSPLEFEAKTGPWCHSLVHRIQASETPVQFSERGYYADVTFPLLEKDRRTLR